MKLLCPCGRRVYGRFTTCLACRMVARYEAASERMRAVRQADREADMESDRACGVLPRVAQAAPCEMVAAQGRGGAA